MATLLTIRDRRQITLPKTFLQTYQLSAGDKIWAEIIDDALVLKPSPQPTVDLFNKIQDLIRETPITESELQRSGQKIRRQLTKQKYGI